VWQTDRHLATAYTCYAYASRSNAWTCFRVELDHSEREKSTDVRSLTVFNVGLTEAQQKRATRRVTQLTLSFVLRDKTIDQAAQHVTKSLIKNTETTSTLLLLVHYQHILAYIKPFVLHNFRTLSTSTVLSFVLTKSQQETCRATGANAVKNDAPVKPIHLSSASRDLQRDLDQLASKVVQPFVKTSRSQVW